MTEKTFDTAEAAARLGCSPCRARQLVADKRLVPFRGPPYLFTMAAIIECLKVWPNKRGPKARAKPAA